MKILLVHPAANYATAEVHDGLAKGLEMHGQEVIRFSLDGRMNVMAQYLHFLHAIKEAAPPSKEEILYQTSVQILERALRFNVDLVLVVAGMSFHPDVVELLHRAHLPIAILCTESPYDDAPQLKMARNAYACWTNERNSLPAFKEVQPYTFYWQHAFDPERHNTKPPTIEMPRHDVVFVGTGFRERVEFLEQVDWTGIDLGLYGVWELLDDDSPLRQCVQSDAIPNEWAIAAYKAAKMSFSLHRRSVGYGPDALLIDEGAASSLGPRDYELAASGVFFISDDRAEAEEVFGGALPIFRDPTEFGDMMRWWLGHDKEREERARKLCEAVQGNTFENRARDLIDNLIFVDESRRHENE